MGGLGGQAGVGAHSAVCHSGREMFNGRFVSRPGVGPLGHTGGGCMGAGLGGGGDACLRAGLFVEGGHGVAAVGDGVGGLWSGTIRRRRWEALREHEVEAGRYRVPDPAHPRG